MYDVYLCVCATERIYLDSSCIIRHINYMDVFFAFDFCIWFLHLIFAFDSDNSISWNSDFQTERNSFYFDFLLRWLNGQIEHISIDYKLYFEWLRKKPNNKNVSSYNCKNVHRENRKNVQHFVKLGYPSITWRLMGVNDDLSLCYLFTLYTH